MKTIALLLVTLSFFISGCASTESSGKPKPDQGSAKQPEIGMTKQQVLDLYGKTDNMQVSSEGETWVITSTWARLSSRSILATAQRCV